jgi:hypothetical protein
MIAQLQMLAGRLPLYAGFYGTNVLESRLPRGGYDPVRLRKVPTALVVFWRSPRDNGPLRAARPPGFARALTMPPHAFAAATLACTTMRWKLIWRARQGRC